MRGIFTFHGTDHKCGASMLSQCVAERLSERLPGAVILLIHMESSRGLDYSPKAEESIELIRPYITERLIDMEEVLKRSHYREKLHIIGGSDRIGSESSFTPEMGEYLLSELSNAFSFIICDSGCCMEQGLSLGALLSADSVLLLSNQSENALRRFEGRKALFEQLKLRPERLIVNACNRACVNTPELIARRMGFEREHLLCVRHSPHSDEAEHDGVSLLAFKEKAFIKDIDRIVDFIIQKKDRADVI